MNNKEKTFEQEVWGAEGKFYFSGVCTRTNKAIDVEIAMGPKGAFRITIGDHYKFDRDDSSDEDEPAPAAATMKPAAVAKPVAKAVVAKPATATTKATKSVTKVVEKQKQTEVSFLSDDSIKSYSCFDEPIPGVDFVVKDLKLDSDDSSSDGYEASHGLSQESFGLRRSARRRY